MEFNLTEAMDPAEMFRSWLSISWNEHKSVAQISSSDQHGIE